MSNNYIKIGISSCGIAAGADRVWKVFEKESGKRHFDLKIYQTGCIGLCYAEPIVIVKTEGMPEVIYGKVDEDMVHRIIDEHIEKKRILNDAVYFLRSKNILNKEETSDADSNGKNIIFVKNTEREVSKDAYTCVKKAVEETNADFEVVRAKDVGIYNKGVVLIFYPEGKIYAGIKCDNLSGTVAQIIKKEGDYEKYLYRESEKQLRIVLRNCGIIDPESIDDYIERGGYKAVEKILHNYSREEVINELKVSGLRGRGGAGFPIWMKWNFARSAEGEEKYIICNADEGDPGAYMDRSILEGDPHSVIEGMITGGYAIGANKGFFYIRAEYPLAIKRVNRAIEQAYSKGFLGSNILGSNFSFDLEVRLGAGAFVCGEETALISSLEGKRGTPIPRPPYPSQKGLWGKPTVINNVETLANVPTIIMKGGSWFSKIGSEKSKGTKVFAITGKVKNSGLIEVPMGISLEEIVFEIGGGIIKGKKLKAVQTGGPSGGVIPVDLLKTKVDYENLQKLGSIMGSGGMIVMDEDDCMVDIAKFYLGFCVDESCGKCAPCRIGGYQMLNILKKITEGKSNLKEIEKLEKISKAMQKASLCGLGQTAANPVLSTLKYFREEYLAHIKDKKCFAFKCKNLITYSIIQEQCKRCGVCVRNCPVGAIAGNREDGYYIMLDKCVKCGKCFDVCKFGAINRK